MRLYSIIVPVYNVEKYLKDCLESVLNQSYRNLEVVLVDDGSTDKMSGKICDEYAAKDSRVRVFHRKNEGSLMARRYGLKQAKGDYFLFIDSDDYMHRDLLLKVDEIIERTKSDLVAFRFRWVDGIVNSDSPVVFKEGTIIGEGRLEKEQLWKKVVSGCELNNLWTKVMKREIVDIDADYSKYAFLKYGTDLLQCLPVLYNAKKIYFTEDILYYYRVNPNGISAAKSKKKDIKSLEIHLKTGEVLKDEKLKYLKLDCCDTDENLTLFYKKCFESYMDLLCNWFVSENDRKRQEWMLNTVLGEEHLETGKKYVQIDNFSGKYHRLYKLFLRKSNFIRNDIIMLARKEKFVSSLRKCAYSVVKTRKK